jgi:hypothetical protein
MDRWRGVVPKAESTCIGHKRRFAWPQGIEIDLKKSWAPPGTFMGVRLIPIPMKVVIGNEGGG